MNFEFHIFSSKGGFDQYPFDKTASAFKSYASHREKGTLLVIAREPKLARYVYYRGVGSDYIGFAITFNRAQFVKVSQAFAFFDKLYETVVYGGKFLKIRNDGKVEFASGPFSDKAADYEALRNKVAAELETLPKRVFGMLPDSYKIGTQQYSLALHDGDEAILAAISNYDCVFVKNESGSGSDLDYVGQLLKKQYDEIGQLKSQLTEINRQKKQYKTVLFLVLVLLLVGGVAAYVINQNNQTINSQVETIGELNDEIGSQQQQIGSLNNNLGEVKSKLSKKNRSFDSIVSVLKEARDSVNMLDREVSSLQSSNRSLRSDVSDLEREVRNLKKNQSNYVSSSAPFTISSIDIANVNYSGDIITSYGNTIYGSQTMYLKPRIKYSCNTSGTYEIIVKFYYKQNGEYKLSTGSTSPSGCSYSAKMYFNSGSGKTMEFSGWGGTDKGHWKANDYLVEFWYNGSRLAYKYFTVY